MPEQSSHIIDNFIFGITQASMKLNFTYLKKYLKHSAILKLVTLMDPCSLYSQYQSGPLNGCYLHYTPASQTSTL